MGSPLVPVLANILMGFYKSKCLNKYNLKPKFYLNFLFHSLIRISFYFEKGSHYFYPSFQN